MTLNKILTLLNVEENTWSTLPNVQTFEFSNQRYIHTTEPSSNLVRWFKVLDTDDNDPVLLLQIRNKKNEVLTEGITYDRQKNIHHVFFVSEITGVVLK